MNVMVFSGNCGRDFEVRHTPNGKAIGSVRVATKQGYGQHERTTWVEVKVFGERAVKLAGIITKGMKLTVHGEFTIEEWEKDGVTRQKLVCVARDIDLPQRQGQQSTAKVQMKSAGVDFEDSIPF